jgi:hypothetical protein
MTTGTSLYTIDSRNPKDIIIRGLELKIEEQGALRVGFDITTDYPSRETFQHDLEEHRRHKRRIVVRKMNNVIHKMGIGKLGGGGWDIENNLSTDYYGWVDQYMLEVSVWSPDSSDRDNIVELVKLWMLELEQEIQAGYVQLPFLLAQDMFSVKFVRAYEDANYNLIQNGPMYIGSLVYECLIPFFHENREDLETYKFNLIGNIVDKISLEAKPTDGGSQ